MIMPYDVDALCRLAERALCAMPFVDNVEVDAEELVALLAEFRRMQPVVRAALECRVASTTQQFVILAGELVAAVKQYLAQRKAAGVDGAPEPWPDRRPPGLENKEAP